MFLLPIKDRPYLKTLSTIPSLFMSYFCGKSVSESSPTKRCNWFMVHFRHTRDFSSLSQNLRDDHTEPPCSCSRLWTNHISSPPHDSERVYTLFLQEKCLWVVSYEEKSLVDGALVGHFFSFQRVFLRLFPRENQ